MSRTSTSVGQSNRSAKHGTAKLCDAIIDECSKKHMLHPLDMDVNGDYHVELTFTVQELRNFLLENGVFERKKQVFDD